MAAAMPSGASSTASCLLYHLADKRTRTTSRMLLNISEATFLVMDMSNGLTSSPSGPLSTILSAYLPSSAINRPSYSRPCPIREDMKKCQPELLFTMQGRGITTCLPFHSVICQPYESPMCPNRISDTLISSAFKVNEEIKVINITSSFLIPRRRLLPCFH